LGIDKITIPLGRNDAHHKADDGQVPEKGENSKGTRRREAASRNETCFLRVRKIPKKRRKEKKVVKKREVSQQQKERRSALFGKKRGEELHLGVKECGNMGLLQMKKGKERGPPYAAA